MSNSDQCTMLALPRSASGRMVWESWANTATPICPWADAPTAQVLSRINPAVGVVEALDDHTCVLITGADTVETVAVYIGMLGLDFTVPNTRAGRPSHNTGRALHKSCSVSVMMPSAQKTSVLMSGDVGAAGLDLIDPALAHAREDLLYPPGSECP